MTRKQLLALVPSGYRDFLRDTYIKLDAAGIKLKIHDTKYIDTGDGVPCTGYFCDEDMILAVSVKGKINRWGPVLVHESCHLDQYIEQAKVWVDVDNHHLTNYWEWITKERDFKPRYVGFITKRAINMELDCEKRVIDKINKYKLPICKSIYIQKSNAYLYTYLYAAQYRQWTKPGKGGYTIPSVWRNFPKDFENDYSVLPNQYRDLYNLHCMASQQSAIIAQYKREHSNKTCSDIANR